MIVVFAGALTAIVLLVGLVIDGGYAFSQRRGAQNAADFAALAGARIIAENISQDTVNGTDANVKAAIVAAVSSNGAAPITFGVAGAPQYVDSNGAIVPSSGSAASFVGNGVIPSGAVGVKVNANRSWKPFFLGVIGVANWTASANATAKGGYSTGAPSGPVFPAAISQSFFQSFPFCTGPVSANPADACYPHQITPGNLNVPGGFGWLSFGCAGDGLGQDAPANAGGCRVDKPFLQTEIGPPGQSFGCCTKVGTGSLDRIGSLTGAKASANCSYYITNQITVTVPVFDTAGGKGSNAWYHIVGYAGFQITACDSGKSIAGVWRKVFFTGPTSLTPPSNFQQAPLGTQLVQ
jgi:hypothetical protein